MCSTPVDVEARVGEGRRADERPQQVVRLEAEHARDPGGRSQCSIGQRRAVAMTVSDGSGLTACGVADAGEQRRVEDAVAAGVAVGQVDARPSAQARTALSLPVPQTKPS